MSNSNSFKLATLAASIALAMASTAALAAAPTATQLPGAGAVVVGGTPTVTTTAPGAQSIALSGNTVINWGAATGATINASGASSQPGGFNIGSGASLAFTGTNSSVLNVDVSGNASQIFGALSSSAGNLYVANANGIIVGATATISASAGDVGLIANTLGDTSATSPFATSGTIASIGFNGTGGNVTVNTGANINSGTTNNVLISGGGTVNVDLSTLTGGNATVSAGLPGAGGAFATTNPNASLVASGTQGAATLVSFASAGNASTSGTLTLGSNAAVAGTLTNTGALTLGAGFNIVGALVNNKTVTQTAAASAGSLTNNGTITGGAFGLNTTAGGLTNGGQITTTGAISVTGGDLTNTGQIGTSGTTVAGGNLINGGTITGGGQVNVTGGNVTNSGSMAVVSVQTINGSIVNNGTITGGGNFGTSSNASLASFTKGADYSITNNGTITSWNNFYISANVQDNQTSAKGTPSTLNGSTGSFTNTGTLQVSSSNSGLQVYTNNDISLGGKLQIVNGTTVKTVSASNPLINLDLEAGGYSYDKVFTSGGVLTVSTPLAVNTSTIANGFAFLAGNQVNLLSNISNVDASGNPAGYVAIAAGAQQASGYAVRVGSGATVSADSISVNGDVAGDNPNVLVNGTLAANTITFGEGVFEAGFSAPHPAVAISDLFTGPNGSLVMYSDADGDFNPYLGLNFTGTVKTVPYNNASNFRFNGLNVNVTDGSTLFVELNPSAYQTNGTSNGLSAVNLLVNSNVNLLSDLLATTAGAPGINGSAVTGVINLPNTHLVLQSSGSITTLGSFYWPGYVYLGNVAANADGSAAPGTLGLGTITTGGDFSNVLPGDIAGASGIHFITQFPMTLHGNVITNANAWVNFGTDLLTQAYASGTLGNGQFFGGAQGSGSVVNYGPLASADFATQAPSATP